LEESQQKALVARLNFQNEILFIRAFFIQLVALSYFFPSGYKSYMKTLLRFYLVLIFASNAFDAGSANDSINSGNPIEESNFASHLSGQQNPSEITPCINTSDSKDSNEVEGITLRDFSK
jgi:hypothetical protein